MCNRFLLLDRIVGCYMVAARGMTAEGQESLSRANREEWAMDSSHSDQHSCAGRVSYGMGPSGQGCRSYANECGGLLCC